MLYSSRRRCCNPNDDKHAVMCSAGVCGVIPSAASWWQKSAAVNLLIITLTKIQQHDTNSFHFTAQHLAVKQMKINMFNKTNWLLLKCFCSWIENSTKHTPVPTTNTTCMWADLHTALSSVASGFEQLQSCESDWYRRRVSVSASVARETSSFRTSWCR